MKKMILTGLLIATAMPTLADEAKKEGEAKNPFIEKVFVKPAEFEKDPPVSGKMIGDNCDACHGTQGRVFDEGMPPLAGIPKDKFIELMMDFKNEKRPAIIMNHVARAFTDGEIERIAEYFSAQPATPWRAKKNALIQGDK